MVFTTVALGGFRGLISDALWLRIGYLQSRAEYVEIVQLADWVTKLDPRSGETWDYHAWNMAFNVTAMMAEPDDRWRWVQNGIRLLRDEGAKYNPGDPHIQRGLAWIYLLKIGGTADPAHRFYRFRLAEEMPREGVAPGLAPNLAREISARYGALDWRLPETHALYWALAGRRLARERGEALSCERLVYQSLSALFFRGRLEFDAAQDVYRTAPAPDLLPAVLEAYEEAVAQYPSESVRTAYATFLTRAIPVLCDLDRAKARELFDRLHARFPTPETAAGFDSFVAPPRPAPRP